MIEQQGSRGSLEPGDPIHPAPTGRPSEGEQKHSPVPVFEGKRQGDLMRLACAGRAAIIVTLALTSITCRRDGPASRQKDRPDGTIATARPPSIRRVVSLMPSATAIIIALAATDRLIARATFDQDPVLNHLPVVGDVLTPNLEILTQLEPDLLVAWNDPRVLASLAALRRLGTIIHPVEARTLEDMRRTALEIGELLGLARNADSLVAAIDSGLTAARRSVAGRPRPRVLYLAWENPPVTAGPGTFVDELIEIAGGQNLFADAMTSWPAVSLEIIVARDPDLIIWPQNREGMRRIEDLQSMGGWQAVQAVRLGNVAIVDQELFAHPGPGVVDAVTHLARLLHPDLPQATP